MAPRSGVSARPGVASRKIKARCSLAIPAASGDGLKPLDRRARAMLRHDRKRSFAVTGVRRRRSGESDRLAALKELATPTAEPAP